MRYSIKYYLMFPAPTFFYYIAIQMSMQFTSQQNINFFWKEYKRYLNLSFFHHAHESSCVVWKPFVTQQTMGKIIIRTRTWRMIQQIKDLLLTSDGCIFQLWMLRNIMSWCYMAQESSGPCHFMFSMDKKISLVSYLMQAATLTVLLQKCRFGSIGLQCHENIEEP